MIFPQFLEVVQHFQCIYCSNGLHVCFIAYLFVFFSFPFYGVKLLHLLESSRKLKGKVKTGDEPGWSATRGLRSVLYVLLYFCICLLNLITSFSFSFKLKLDICGSLECIFLYKLFELVLFILFPFYYRQRHWLRRIRGTCKLKENKLRDM